MRLLHEPLWWQKILLAMHTIMDIPFFAHRAPILADVFVFVYPVYLFLLYMYGFIYKKVVEKQAALWIFWAAMCSTLFNIVFQFFVIKDRPDVALDLLYQKKEELVLHKYLPEASFPSDHAMMSMSIAVATLLRGLRYKKKWYVYFSIFLFAISLVMWWGRITIGVHWPTDIIGGYVVGIGIPLLLFHGKIYRFVKKWLIDRLVWVQEKIVGR